MTSHKHRRKARRQAEKLMDAAWEAVVAGDAQRAVRESSRAVDAGGGVNARLWLDHGRILLACGAAARRGEFERDAENAFRQAIALAPTWADAVAALARLQAERDKLEAAARLFRHATELAPADVELARDAAALADHATGPADDGRHDDDDPVGPAWRERVDRYDWNELAQTLRAAGAARLPELLTRDECADLIALWDRVDAFEHEVVADSDNLGVLAYRFLSTPLPDLVADLRASVYAEAATIANAWNRELGRADRFPPTLGGFLARCRAADQHRPTPILLRYAPGGFNAPHRDVSGRVVFPLQLAVTLGPGCARGPDGTRDGEDHGGELRLVDVRPGRKSRERRIGTGIGDGVLFCTAERLVDFAGTVALQPVLHGATATRDERFVLGVPFHDHA